MLTPGVSFYGNFFANFNYLKLLNKIKNSFRKIAHVLASCSEFKHVGETPGAESAGRLREAKRGWYVACLDSGQLQNLHLWKEI